MRKASAILYRFRGYILALFAVALIAFPAQPLPEKSVPVFPLNSTITSYICASLLLLAGILLRIHSRRFIGKHTRGSKHEADELVTTGPYSRTRHPLYISNTLVACSAIVLHLGFTLPAGVFAVAVILFEFARAHAEDRFLEERFGETWQNWARMTPIIPIPFSRKKAPKKAVFPKRTFLQAFRADCSTWIWIAFFNLILVSLKTLSL